MAKNFVKPGNVVTAIAPSGGVTSGVGVLIGNLFGVALVTADENEEFELAVTGEWELDKTSALEIVAGDIVYWDDTAKEVNKTSDDQKPVGIATVTAANPSATVRVLINCNVVPAVADA